MMMSVQCVKMVGSSSAVMGVLEPSTSPAWCRPSPPYPGTEQSCDTQATDPTKPRADLIISLYLSSLKQC